MTEIFASASLAQDVLADKQTLTTQIVISEPMTEARRFWGARNRRDKNTGYP
jgi:hypothetical protein